MDCWSWLFVANTCVRSFVIHSMLFLFLADRGIDLGSFYACMAEVGQQLTPQQEDALHDLEDVLEGCREAFQEVDDALTRCMRVGIDGKITIPRTEKLKWPLRSSELELLRANLERLKTTLLFMLSALSYGAKASQIAAAANSQARVELSLGLLQIEGLLQAKIDAAQRYEDLKKGFEELRIEVQQNGHDSSGTEMGNAGGEARSVTALTLAAAGAPQVDPDRALRTTSIDPSDTVATALDQCSSTVSDLTKSIETATKTMAFRAQARPIPHQLLPPRNRRSDQQPRKHGFAEQQSITSARGPTSSNTPIFHYSPRLWPLENPPHHHHHHHHHPTRLYSEILTPVVSDAWQKSQKACVPSLEPHSKPKLAKPWCQTLHKRAHAKRSCVITVAQTPLRPRTTSTPAPVGRSTTKTLVREPRAMGFRDKEQEEEVEEAEEEQSNTEDAVRHLLQPAMDGLGGGLLDRLGGTSPAEEKKYQRATDCVVTI
ncbi:hypothetical protein CERZMDRAFT_86611 [Cercospora zeae-maydis SCOH1-5]|uniref:Fungal N-terminal domain-containing protein n=1 Tax=Cercospora zeae-maydis SCOH1-5 TaxID=717836 RepID=A0A6A6F9A5_9PEZI|nr:hypothetical protein CERZMDRAFT_86611 [Cercospora zeae-maydis SCOH1-5]